MFYSFTTRWSTQSLLAPHWTIPFKRLCCIGFDWFFFKANLPGFSGGTRGNGNPTAPLMKKLGTRRKENEGKLNFTEWKKMKIGFLKSRNKLKLEPNQKRDSYSKFSIDSIVYFYQLNRSIRLKLTKSWKETSSLRRSFPTKNDEARPRVRSLNGPFFIPEHLSNNQTSSHANIWFELTM